MLRSRKGSFCLARSFEKCFFITQTQGGICAQTIQIKSRTEEIFLNCKCMRNYLELTPTQEKELNKLLDELRELEINKPITKL